MMSQAAPLQDTAVLEHYEALLAAAEKEVADLQVIVNSLRLRQGFSPDDLKSTHPRPTTTTDLVLMLMADHKQRKIPEITKDLIALGRVNARGRLPSYGTVGEVVTRLEK